MALSLNDLLTPETEAEIFERFVTMLAASDFPITAFNEGDAALTIIEKESLLLAEMGEVVKTIAEGGYVSSAKGPWLDLLIEGFFQVPRISAVSTEGVLVLADAGGGPHTIVPNQLTVRYGLLRFTNTTGGTLAANGTLALSWRARATGAGYNAVPTGASLDLATAIPGVTATAAAIGVTGSWITQVGADAEPDEAYRRRAMARWPKLGRGGGTAECFDAWAREASPEVRKVYVAEAYPSEGKVTVYIYGTSGPVSPGAKLTVGNYLRVPERKPLCVDVLVGDVATTNVPVTGTITCKASLATDVIARAEAVLLAYEVELGISEDVIRSELIQRLMDLDGVVDVTLTAPLANVNVPAGSVANLISGLSPILADG